MWEALESSNNKIDYSSVRNMKFCIKHEELKDDSIDVEEDLEESKGTSIKKIIVIC